MSRVNAPGVYPNRDSDITTKLSAKKLKYLKNPNIAKFVAMLINKNTFFLLCLKKPENLE